MEIKELRYDLEDEDGYPAAVMRVIIGCAVLSKHKDQWLDVSELIREQDGRDELSDTAIQRAIWMCASLDHPTVDNERLNEAQLNFSGILWRKNKEGTKLDTTSRCT